MTDKCNMLCILRILEEYSDSEHPMSIRDITDKMMLLYDRKADRRTIYSALLSLSDFGYDIGMYGDNDGKGYCLMSRDFSLGELRLLIDAVFSCKYISPPQTEEILEKLRKMLSEHDRKKFRYSNIAAPEKKTSNPEVFLNIETLDEAINAKKKISFIYVDYDYDKKLKPRRKDRYTGCPYAMVVGGEHYYLSFLLDGHDKASFYRIDMMKDIAILDSKIEISKKQAGVEHMNKGVYAHTGKPETIRLHCKKSALRYVIEEFGKETSIIKKEDGSFEAVFKAAPEGMKYWALQYLDKVEVLSPESLRKSITEIINGNPYTKTEGNEK